MHLQLQAFGDQELSRELLRFADRGEDLSPALDVIARDFYEMQKQQFTSEGRRAFGGGWPQLTPGYAAWKARLFPGKKILERTGALKSALTQPNAPGSRKRVTPDSLEILVDLGYAGFHQTGTSKMARRRPVDLTESDKRRWTKIMQSYIATGDAGTGIGIGL